MNQKLKEKIGFVVTAASLFFGSGGLVSAYLKGKDLKIVAEISETRLQATIVLGKAVAGVDP